VTSANVHSPDYLAHNNFNYARGVPKWKFQKSIKNSNGCRNIYSGFRSRSCRGKPTGQRCVPSGEGELDEKIHIIRVTLKFDSYLMKRAIDVTGIHNGW
jgi:hypothetical protein